MPVYCYETEDGVIDVMRPVRERDEPLDGKKLKRVLPDRFLFNGAIDWKPQDAPMTQKQEVYNVAKNMELNGLGHKIKYTKKQMDRIWADED